MDIEVSIVTPGQLITTDSGFMRGHGTYVKPAQGLVASVAGQVCRVNKLVSVKAPNAAYLGEIGDVVVGRITELGTKRWLVDIQSRQEGMLLLSSIHLPGGVQRRKSESDERQMRNFFSEGDLLSAEIQAFFHDGAASLSTRNLKYGKLRNGMLVQVPCNLIKRSVSHFISMGTVDVVLGLNGNVWVSAHVLTLTSESADLDLMYTNQNKEIPKEVRVDIIRAANCIRAIAMENQVIHEELLVAVFNGSKSLKLTDIVDPKHRQRLITLALGQIS